MAFHEPKHSLVIKVHLQELMNKFPKCSNDYAQENHRHILQSERNYNGLKTPPLSRNGRLAPILWYNFDLMVPKEPISEGVRLLDTYII